MSLLSSRIGGSKSSFNNQPTRVPVLSAEATEKFKALPVCSLSTLIASQGKMRLTHLFLIKNLLATPPIFQFHSIFRDFPIPHQEFLKHLQFQNTYWHHVQHGLLPITNFHMQIFKIPRNKKVSTPMMRTNSLFFVALMDAVIISKPLCASIISTTSIVRHDVFRVR